MGLGRGMGYLDREWRPGYNGKFRLVLELEEAKDFKINERERKRERERGRDREGG